jgi:outer membrane protein assembly factor BamB
MSEVVIPETRRMVARIALSVALVAAAFVLVMCALLTATHLQLKRADPLNNEMLLSMRDRYAAGERTEQVKADIRQLDLLSRKAFLTSQNQIVSGGLLAVLAAVVMTIAFGVHKAATRNVPPPSDDNCEGVFWAGLERSRVWIAGGTVVLVAVSIVMSVSTPTELTAELGMAAPKAPAVPTPAGAPLKPTAPTPVSTVPVLPAGFAHNAPVFRGAGGSGRTAFADVPIEWDAAAGKNLLWKKSIELPAWAAPVVWGDKVIALGADADKRIVYCLDAGSGDEVWTSEVPVHADATKKYETDTMDDRWESLMYAGGTPAVNG